MRTRNPMCAFCWANTCSTRARTADLRALARALAGASAVRAASRLRLTDGPRPATPVAGNLHQREDGVSHGNLSASAALKSWRFR